MHHVFADVLQAEQEDYLEDYFTKYDSILLSNNFADPYIGFRRYASDSSLVDFLIISEIAKNADSYIYSTYLHKDRDDEDGRMKFGPLWDYDLSFGNTHFQSGNKIDGWQWDINLPATYKIENLLSCYKIDFGNFVMVLCITTPFWVT
jgi:hypothetical protein